MVPFCSESLMLKVVKCLNSVLKQMVLAKDTFFFLEYDLLFHNIVTSL